MADLSFTILGCGSSGGVPRLGGNWGDCDPNNSKNQRSRCSLLVELKGKWCYNGFDRYIARHAKPVTQS